MDPGRAGGKELGHTGSKAPKAPQIEASPTKKVPRNSSIFRPEVKLPKHHKLNPCQQRRYREIPASSETTGSQHRKPLI